MNIISRFKNAYDSGGFKEIVRKSFFHYVYRFNNVITSRRVNSAPLQYGLNKNERDVRVIVSLTSFPKRFPTLHLCLKSLLLQDIKPDKIIVYFGSDAREEDLTHEMIELKEYGVEYRFDRNRNLRAHKKYFYAMQEFPDDIIVTADDDLYYPKDWLSSLLRSYNEYPNAISARRVHLMKKGENGLEKYNKWEDQTRKIRRPSNALFATGGSGKLYPPHCLIEKTFDEKAIMELCFEADDVWLKCMEMLSGMPVVWTKNLEVDQIGVERKQKEALSNENVDQGLNDQLLNNVMKRYGIPSDTFFCDPVGESSNGKNRNNHT